MTRFIIAICSLMVVGTATASAQGRALESAQGRTVFVIDEDRREWQGRLVRVSPEALDLESDAGIRRFVLADVRRVDADGDGLRDGFLKGFAIGSLLSIGYLLDSEVKWATLASGLVYGLIGAGIDAGCSGRHPVFHGESRRPVEKPAGSKNPALAVGMRIRW